MSNQGGNSTKASKKHPGVSLIQRATGWVARWRDPETGRNLSQSLRGIAMSASERLAWAAQKSIELKQTKLDMKAGTFQQKKLERIEAEQAAGNAIEGILDAGTPIGEALTSYVESHQNPKTKVTRNACYTHFKLWCLEHDIVGTRKLSDDVLRAYSAKLRKEMNAGKRAQSTTRTWLAYLSAFLTDLPKSQVDSAKLDRTPGEMKKSLKKPDRPETDNVVMQPEQAQAVLESVHAYDAAPSWQDKAKGDYGPFVLALLLGGFRPNELRKLTFGMIHDTFIQVTATMSKTKRARRVTFEETPTLRRLMVAMRDAAGKPKANKLVFPNKSGWQDAKTNRMSRDFGLDPEFTLKHCRSTADTVLLYTPGINVTGYQIERRHGHSAEVIREHYAGEFRPVSKKATSIEAALDIEEIADEIIARVRKTALGEVAA
tara:strand:+ start:22 stop:1314 length:1293 start_codon:yes stop_codon:yes gene_type:complete